MNIKQSAVQQAVKSNVDAKKGSEENMKSLDDLIEVLGQDELRHVFGGRPKGDYGQKP